MVLGWLFRLELATEIAFNIRTKLSNDIDRVRVAHCGLCLGFCGKAQTQLRLGHAVLAHTQCVLTSLRSVATRVATH